MSEENNTEVDDQKGNEEPKDQKPPAPSQEKFSKRERLEHAREKIERQLDELESAEDDDKPLTKGDFKKMQQEETRKTALDLAQSIEDDDERAEVSQILQTRINPSDDPKADLELARGAVNARKLKMQNEEESRRMNPNQYPNTPSAPGPKADDFRPTDEEKIFMSAPYNMTKEQVIEARQRATQKNQGY